MHRIVEALAGAALIGAHLAFGPLLHRWRTRWGASDAEVGRTLPGDEFVPDPDWCYTRAITIDAPRSAVWPWLMQLGQGRGGFYSYEALENLAGCGIHNLLEIRPGLQRLEVGDTVRLHKSGYGPAVTLLEPERTFVMGGPPGPDGSCITWGFHLLDGPDGATRLLERGRHKAGRGLAARLGTGPYLIDPISFVMSRKMLRTIKRLAEATRADPDRAPAAAPA